VRSPVRASGRVSWPADRRLRRADHLRANENQGVESTLALLSALPHARRLDAAGDPVLAGHRSGAQPPAEPVPSFDAERGSP